jgi:hypothetical protein
MSERREAPESLGERRPADRVEDEIDAAPVREPHRFRRKVMSFIVDNFFGAEFSHEGDFVIARDGADDARSRGFRDLHGRDTDSARR